MTTGIRPRIKGLKPDKSGKRLVVDRKAYDASKQAKMKGGGSKRVRYGKRGSK
jgi:hypothetical protein